MLIFGRCRDPAAQNPYPKLCSQWMATKSARIDRPRKCRSRAEQRNWKNTPNWWGSLFLGWFNKRLLVAARSVRWNDYVYSASGVERPGSKVGRHRAAAATPRCERKVPRHPHSPQNLVCSLPQLSSPMRSLCVDFHMGYQKDPLKNNNFRR